MSGTRGIVVGSWTHQLHRWVAIAFTVTVISNFIALTIGALSPWMTYLPPLPLAVLLLTGLFLFMMPYAAKSHSGRGA